MTDNSFLISRSRANFATSLIGRSKGTSIHLVILLNEHSLQQLRRPIGVGHNVVPELW